MAKPVVAYLGPAASYTNQAAISTFPEGEYDLNPQTTIQNVFSAVQKGEATHGVVPFENSTNGSVIFTLDLFADRHQNFTDVRVEGEVYLEVEHCLVGRTNPENKEEKMNQPWRRVDEKTTATNGDAATGPNSSATKPLYPLDHIKELYSHPQAWGQCNTFINKHFQGLPQKDSSSTSQAAKSISQDPTGTSAAIASRLAAKIYGLDILAEVIQDLKGNCTRFLILRNKSSTTPSLSQPPANSLEEIELSSYKSLITFTVPHTRPGALADCLSVFKTHNLNLTNFQSRPSGSGVPWNYIFFVEFRGRPREKGLGAVNDALKELDQAVEGWKFLGSWKDMLGSGEEKR